MSQSNSEIIIFKASDNEAGYELLLGADNETIWASEQEISYLFGRDRTVVSRHIKKTFKEEN